MKISLALILMLLIASTASAAPVTKITGPYKISFDLNTTLNYTTILSQPFETPKSFTYKMLIKTNNSTLAQVAIYESKNLSDSTLETGKLVAEQGMINIGYFYNISSADLVIDKKKGFILTGLNARKARIFRAYYWTDSQDCQCGPVSVGKTEVEVISSYQLNVTKNLLTSLHLEKTQPTEKPKTLTFLPPKIVAPYLNKIYYIFLLVRKRDLLASIADKMQHAIPSRFAKLAKVAARDRIVFS